MFADTHGVKPAGGFVLVFRRRSFSLPFAFWSLGTSLVLLDMCILTILAFCALVTLESITHSLLISLAAALARRPAPRFAFATALFLLLTVTRALFSSQS